MPSITDPNLGMQYGWSLGENGWGNGMDANLKRLGAVIQLSVQARDLKAVPVSPANGDRYLIPTGATGIWAGKTDQLAVRIAGNWEFYAPKVGWLCYIENEAVLSVYQASGWSAGLTL